MTCRKLVDIMGLLGFLAAPGLAWGSDALLGANTAAMGGTAVAHPRDTATLTANPGALALTERYDLQAHVLAGAGGYEGAVSAVDSQMSRLTLGFAYRRQLTHPAYRDDELPGWTVDGVLPPNRKRYHDVVVAAAMATSDRRLSFGLAGTASLYEHDRLGGGVSGNLDLGVAARPVDHLTVALALNDPLPVRGHADRPLVTMLGGRYEVEDVFAAAVDVGYAFEDVPSPLVLRAGAEVGIQSARLRVGYRHEGPDAVQRVTWGLGAVGPAGAFEYAMEIPVATELTLGGLVHRLGIRMSLPGQEPGETEW